MCSRFKHAVVARIPAEPIVSGGRKENIDLNEARNQLDTFCEQLRHCGVNLVELAPEDSALSNTLWVDDQAVVINGTALITRPRHKARAPEMTALLHEYAWQTFETPEIDATSGNAIVLEGSDVVFTGKEIFVGVHSGKNDGTNFEGARYLAKIFADYAVVPIDVDGPHSLKFYVCVAAHSNGAPILTIGSSKHALSIRQQIEREATFRYSVLTQTADEDVNCLALNAHLLCNTQHSPNANLAYHKLDTRTKLVNVELREMLKLGGLMSQYCLLVPDVSHAKRPV